MSSIPIREQYCAQMYLRAESVVAHTEHDYDDVDDDAAGWRYRC